MTYINSVNTIEIDLANRISNALGGFATSLKNFRKARQTARILSALSTRELDDLGISRAMIRSVAIEAAYNN